MSHKNSGRLKLLYLLLTILNLKALSTGPWPCKTNKVFFNNLLLSVFKKTSKLLKTIITITLTISLIRIMIRIFILETLEKKTVITSVPTLIYSFDLSFNFYVLFLHLLFLTKYSNIITF